MRVRPREQSSKLGAIVARDQTLPGMRLAAFFAED
jgi:hypothetical protein